MSVVRPIELLPNYARSKQPKVAIPTGYCDHDDCGYYKCPVCGEIVTSLDFYFAKRDYGKNTVTCICGTELKAR